MLSDAQRKARLAGPSSKKVKFTKAEDTKLALLVQEYSENDWKTIAENMVPRTARQCRERWTNYVNPSLSKDPWTQEEDLLLLEKHKEFGNHWKLIERYFPKRSKNGIKHRWASLKDIISPSSPLGTVANTSNIIPEKTPVPPTPAPAPVPVPSTHITIVPKPTIKTVLPKPQQPKKQHQLLVPPSAIPQQKPFIAPQIQQVVPQQILPPVSIMIPAIPQMPFSIDETDTIRESTSDPFQFFDRILDQHDSYIQSLDKSDLWSISEENFF